MSPFSKKNLTPKSAREKDEMELRMEELEEMVGKDDVSLGHNKDVTDHLGDIERLSMRELDKKSEKEQNRILKTGYQRMEDKASHLNKMYQDSEVDSAEAKRIIADLKKEDKKKGTTIRHFCEEFLGAQKLKEITETGSWTSAMVEPLVVAEMKKNRERLSSLEEEIEKEVFKATQEKDEEILTLKEKLAKFREAFGKVGEIKKELEELKLFKKNTLAAQSAKGQVKEEMVAPVEQTKTEEAIPKTSKPAVEFQKDLPKKEVSAPTEKQKENKPQPKSETEGKLVLSFPNDEVKPVVENKPEESHKPHFADFYEEFNSDKKEEKTKKVKKEIIDDFFDENISHYLGSLTENQKVVLRLIGQTGVSRLEELMIEAEKDKEAKGIYMENGVINRSSIGDDLGAVRDRGTCIENVDVKLNAKGNEKYSLFRLTNVGKQCFKMNFKEDPVYSEIDSLIEEFGSLEKAFLARDLDTVYTIKGYNRIPSDKVDVLYEKDGNKLPIMLVLEDESENDLFDRIDSYIKNFGQKVYMVTATQELAKKVNLMFGNYIGKITRQKAIEMKLVQYVAPINKMKKLLPNPWAGMDPASVKGTESPLYPF